MSAPSAIEQWIASLPEDQRARALESVQIELNNRAQALVASANATQPQFNSDNYDMHLAAAAPAPHAASNPSHSATSPQHANSNHAVHTVSVSSIRTPPPDHFRGDRAKVEEFADQLQRYIALSSISTMAPAVQVQQAAMLLKDEALVWFRNSHTIANPITSIDDFVTRMRAYFLPYGYDKLARTRLRSLRQQTTVQVYNTLFMRTMQHITDMAPADQLEYYMFGLKDKIKERLWAKEPTSLQDAMTEATLAEARYQHFDITTRHGAYSSNRHAPYRSSSIYTPASSIASSSSSNTGATTSVTSATSDAMDLSKIEAEVNAIQGQQRLGKLSDADRAKLRAEGRCFRCREKGHISVNCPKNGSSQ